MKKLWYWLVGLCARFGNWLFNEQPTDFWDLVIRFVVIIALFTGFVCLVMLALKKAGLLEDASENNNKNKPNWPYGPFGGGW